MPSLTIAESRRRAELLEITGYRLHLDLDQGSETFSSRTEIRFRATEPGASTFLDVKPRTLRSVLLNDVEIDVATLRDGRIDLPGLAAENTVVVEAEMAYSRDGHGLHRAVDPADDQAYVFGMSFLDAAPRIFACFDQPDLKAPYDVRVHVPQGWSVFGNGATTQQGQDAELATTKPLSTYFVTVCAGPWATIRDEHDGIPLSISVRASQRELLAAQAPQMLEITKQSFDYYHQLFGVRYDFGDYDQLFVPEFNAGAMENPGCVVHSDSMIFRGEAGRSELLNRSNTIAHEMAHMWFGDMVTMQWWDDLWLNESFAEYMSHRCLAEATEFTDSFVDFGVKRKSWGYRADSAPSTHPVAGSPAPDALSALQNFDGISYAKGASVLRQLIAHIGDEAFVAGVRDHITQHLYGNATLADFLGAMERASGRDLTDWQQAWLGTAGVDAIGVRLEQDETQIRSAHITRTPPSGYPASRPHTFDVAGYSDGEQVWRADLTISADHQSADAIVGLPAAQLVVPNATDLTWATLALDGDTLQALPQQLASVPDASARAVVWVALDAGLIGGSVDPRLVVDTVRGAWPHESDDGIRLGVALRLLPLLRVFLPESEHAGASAQIAQAGQELLDSQPDDPSATLGAARLVADFTSDTGLLTQWLTGNGLPGDLGADTELRWRVAKRLAALDALGDDQLAALTAEDRTMDGHLQALRISALRPTKSAKDAAWDRFADDESLSNYEQLALVEGIWGSGSASLLQPFVQRYFDGLPALSGRVSGMALARLAGAAYPLPVVTQEVLDRAEAAQSNEDLPPGVRRQLVDFGFLTRSALRSRAHFAEH